LVVISKALLPSNDINNRDMEEAILGSVEWDFLLHA
jgi:hypothetical protein